MKPGKGKESERGGILVNVIVLVCLVLFCTVLYIARGPILRFIAESWMIEDVDGKKVFSGGESNIVVWAINPQTGEPTALQHADIHAAHPRTFALDTSSKMLVAGSLSPTARRENGKVVDIPAGLSVFRVGPDGKLDFVRKYDVDASKLPQWWTGMVPLA